MSLTSISPIPFRDLPGWGGDDFTSLKEAFIKSIQRIKHPESVNVAGQVYNFKRILDKLETSSLTPEFLGAHFEAYKVKDPGPHLFTGYFEPKIKASFEKSETFSTPIYEKPRDIFYIPNLGKYNPYLAGERLAGILKGQELLPYPTRGDIYNGVIEDKAAVLAWTDSLVDFYFLQVQGSGVLEFEDGRQQRIGYSATNGHAYKSIAKHLFEHNLIKDEDRNMHGVKAVLNSMEPEALKKLLSINPSYIFFEKRDGEAPIGSHKVSLVPGRSLAVDPKFVPLGLPIWLDCEHPKGGQIQKLMLAHDTGAAIKGPHRGDYFWGSGDEMGDLASPMKSAGDYFLLLPKN